MQGRFKNEVILNPHFIFRRGMLDEAYFSILQLFLRVLLYVYFLARRREKPGPKKAVKGFLVHCSDYMYLLDDALKKGVYRAQHSFILIIELTM